MLHKLKIEREREKRIGNDLVKKISNDKVRIKN